VGLLSAFPFVVVSLEGAPGLFTLGAAAGFAFAEVLGLFLRFMLVSYLGFGLI
jgi:hypothetical protein